MNSEGIYFPASSEFFIASNEARFLDFGIAAIQESATAIRLLRNCTGCDWFEVLIDRFPANSKFPPHARIGVREPAEFDGACENPVLRSRKVGPLLARLQALQQFAGEIEGPGGAFWRTWARNGAPFMSGIRMSEITTQ
jgi:hypothetical protein